MTRVDLAPETLREDPVLAELEFSLDQAAQEIGFVAVEAAQFELTDEMVDRLMSRRTDNPMHNRDVLRAAYDQETDTFLPEAISYVRQQALTEFAEAEVHLLGAPVTHVKNEEGKWASYLGTLEDNARQGVEALDFDDEHSKHEIDRRVLEECEAILNNTPEAQAGLKAGKPIAFISPKGTHHEIDPDIAESFNYDDRDMLRVHMGSEDGKTKTMYSFSVFDVPIEAWAHVASSLSGRQVESRAIDVMKASNEVGVMDQFDSVQEFLEFVREQIMPFVDDRYNTSVNERFEAFITKQEELLQKAQMYVDERVLFEQDLARSKGKKAIGSVRAALTNLYPNASTERQAIIDEARQDDGEFIMNEDVSLAIWQLKVVSNFNRGGVALENERTLRRLEHSSNAQFVYDIWLFEQESIRLYESGELSLSELNARAGESDANITTIELSCGGGCSVDIMNEMNDLAGTMKARKKGLLGTLYASQEMNRKSKCCANPNVRANGKDKICLNCDASTIPKPEEVDKKVTTLDRLRGIKGDEEEEIEIVKPVSVLEARRIESEERRARFGSIQIDLESSNPPTQSNEPPV